MLALQHGGGGKRDRGRHTKLPPHSSFAEHSPLLSRKENYPPSPSHQVRSPTSLPICRMQAGRLWPQLLFSKSLGFPLHETKLIDLEIRNPPPISLLEEIGLLTVRKWVICKTRDSKVLKRPRVQALHTPVCVALLGLARTLLCVGDVAQCLLACKRPGFNSFPGRHSTSKDLHTTL